MWSSIYETATEPTMRENARNHLIALNVQEDLQHLRPLLARYRERNRICATSWPQVISSGVIPGYPLDPAGKPYQLGPGCRVRVQDPAQFSALEPDQVEVQY
jgi:hypothetical protein